jgi:NAD(P)-dependent dehydrogenase (short-subunit alcohol dehydrogenase family)
MTLADRVALITGGKRIGLAVARELAARGVDIAFTYARSKPEAEEGASIVRAAGRRAMTTQADLSDPAACARVVQETVAELGRLDILINMASVYSRKPFERADRSTTGMQPMRVDLRAAFSARMRQCRTCERKAAAGSSTSATGLRGAAARVTQASFRITSRRPGASRLPRPFHWNSPPTTFSSTPVAPGPIVAPPGTSDDELEKVEQATPLGRWGGEHEIAKAVLAFLDSDFITGETIRVDGGRHLR